VFIPKAVKVVCFDTDSPVFILQELAKHGFEVRTGPEKACKAEWDMTASSLTSMLPYLLPVVKGKIKSEDGRV
jgi:hypothetical protein